MRRFEDVDDYAPPERFRYPREIVVGYVGAADVDDFLAERGITVSHESVRLQVNRFGQLCAGCLSGIDLALPTSSISARSLSRSGAVDDNGVVFDLLVQKHRNAKAAMRFLKGVVTFTTEAATMAVNEWLAGVTGLAGEAGMVPTGMRRFHARDERRPLVEQQPDCPCCNQAETLGRGDMHPFLDMVS